eukprot:1158391-Pelagomonas_calceolata.AAC.2
MVKGGLSAWAFPFTPFHPLPLTPRITTGTLHACPFQAQCTCVLALPSPHPPSPGSSLCAMASLMQSASCPSPSSSSLQYFSISFSHWPAKCEGKKGRGEASWCNSTRKHGIVKVGAQRLRAEQDAQHTRRSARMRLSSTCSTSLPPLTLVVDVIPELDLRCWGKLHLLVAEGGLLDALAPGQPLLHGAVGGGPGRAGSTRCWLGAVPPLGRTGASGILRQWLL